MAEQILIADNQEKFLQKTIAQLRERGYECASASDSLTTANMLRETHYELLIADATLVERFPSDLLTELTHSGKQLIILLVKASLPIGRALRSLRLPAVAYIIKPFRFDELLIEIQKALKGSLIQPFLEGCLTYAPNYRGEKSSASFDLEASKLDAHFPDLLKNLCDSVETIKQQIEMLVSHTSLSFPTNHPPFSELHNNVDNSELGTWSPTFLQALKQLTPREQEILQHLYAHHRVSAIAQMLYISPHTVRNHLKSIYRKLRVKSQVELMMQIGHRALQ